MSKIMKQMCDKVVRKKVFTIVVLALFPETRYHEGFKMAYLNDIFTEIAHCINGR